MFLHLYVLKKKKKARKLGSNIIPWTAIPNTTKMCKFMVPSWGSFMSALSLCISLCDTGDNLHSKAHKQSLHSVHGTPSVYWWGMCTDSQVTRCCSLEFASVQALSINTSPILKALQSRGNLTRFTPKLNNHSHAYHNADQVTQTSKWMSAPYSLSKHFLSLLSVNANIFHDSLVCNTFSVKTLKTEEVTVKQSQSYCDPYSRKSFLVLEPKFH